MIQKQVKERERVRGERGASKSDRQTEGRGEKVEEGTESESKVGGREGKRRETGMEGFTMLRERNQKERKERDGQNQKEPGTGERKTRETYTHKCARAGAHRHGGDGQRELGRSGGTDRRRRPWRGRGSEGSAISAGLAEGRPGPRRRPSPCAPLPASYQRRASGRLWARGGGGGALLQVRWRRRVCGGRSVTGPAAGRVAAAGTARAGARGRGLASHAGRSPPLGPPPPAPAPAPSLAQPPALEGGRAGTCPCPPPIRGLQPTRQGAVLGTCIFPKPLLLNDICILQINKNSTASQRGSCSHNTYVKYIRLTGVAEVSRALKEEDPPGLASLLCHGQAVALRKHLPLSGPQFPPL